MTGWRNLAVKKTGDNAGSSCTCITYVNTSINAGNGLKEATLKGIRHIHNYDNLFIMASYVFEKLFFLCGNLKEVSVALGNDTVVTGSELRLTVLRYNHVFSAKSADNYYRYFGIALGILKEIVGVIGLILYTGFTEGNEIADKLSSVFRTLVFGFHIFKIHILKALVVTDTVIGKCLEKINVLTEIAIFGKCTARGVLTLTSVDPINGSPAENVNLCINAFVKGQNTVILKQNSALLQYL